MSDYSRNCPLIIIKAPEAVPQNIAGIYTGKELLACASSACGMEYDYPEPTDEEEMELFSEFMEIVQQLLDYNSYLDAPDNMRQAFSISKWIKALEERHFWVFCGCYHQTVTGGIMALAPFKILAIKIVRDDDPTIIRANEE